MRFLHYVRGHGVHSGKRFRNRRGACRMEEADCLFHVTLIKSVDIGLSSASAMNLPFNAFPQALLIFLGSENSHPGGYRRLQPTVIQGTMFLDTARVHSRPHFNFSQSWDQRIRSVPAMSHGLRCKKDIMNPALGKLPCRF